MDLAAYQDHFLILAEMLIIDPKLLSESATFETQLDCQLHGLDERANGWHNATL